MLFRLGAYGIKRASFALILGFTSVSSALENNNGDADLQLIKNLKAEVAEAGSNCLPLVVMVSQFSCAYCDQLRNVVLLPILKSGDYQSKAIFRELLIDPGETMLDLNGIEAESIDVASQYIDDIVTPTILILDASGEEIVERIVGIGNIDFFSSYLEAKINSAYQVTQKVCSTKHKAASE
jgi:thioredoxin-related protein